MDHADSLGRSPVTRFYWTLKHLRDPATLVLNFGITATLAGAGLVGFPHVLAFPGLWWLIAAGLLLVVLIVGLCTFLRPTYGVLAKREALARGLAADQQHAIHRTLEAVLRGLGHYLYRDETDCRASAYSVEGDEFVLLARISTNAILERRGRSSYPMWKGVIGAGWATGSALENFDASDRQSWEAMMTESGFTPTEAQALTMPARSICAIRLDHYSDKVGVMVIESETFGRFDVSTLKRARGSLLLTAASEIVASGHTHFPSVIERRGQKRGESAHPPSPEPEWKRTPGR